MEPKFQNSVKFDKQHVDFDVYIVKSELYASSESFFCSKIAKVFSGEVPHYNIWGPQGSRDYSCYKTNHKSNTYKIIRFQFIGFLLIYLETKILYFNIELMYTYFQ
jgi:hypothetical protein